MKKIISALTAFIIAATGCAMAGCGGGPATSDTPVLLTVEQYPDTLYDVGEQFSAEGGVLALHYGGGVSQEISMTAEGVNLSTVDTSAAGSQTVTVTYGGLSTSFVVYVGEMEAATDTPSDPGTDPGGDEDKTVLRITVASNPTVTEFFVGDTVDYSGGMLNVLYTDGTSSRIPFDAEGVTLSNVDTSTAGAKTVTVTYERRRVTFSITVLAVAGVVTFEDYGDSDYEMKVAANRPVTRPEDPVRQGYTFGGWYADEQKTIPYVFGQSISGDVTVYSYWMQEGHTYYDVTYDLNYYGVKIDNYAQIVEAGEAARPIADPVREHFTFDGWFTDEALTHEYNGTDAIASDTTLYAGWTRTDPGEQTYRFEAEDTNLDGKTGMSNSGSPQGADMIVSNPTLGASGDRFVTYLYNQGLSLEFYIASSEEATATISFYIAAELPNIIISQDNYKIYVNGETPDYGTIALDATQGFAAHITMEVTLHEGANLIQLVTDNNVNPVGSGTYNGTAPMVDCIDITTEAVVTWDGVHDLPVQDNY